MKELVPPGEQMALDEALLALVPKERPSADELIASELRAQREEVG